MRDIWFRIAQWTWGLPQTLLGAALRLWYRRAPHAVYRGSVVTAWPHSGGVSLGMFLFVSDLENGRLLRHEYGHALQSLWLGPLFLLVVGIPSFTWANLPCLARYRREKHRSYYDFYTECWADRLGGKA